jgi:hypothetical protein
MGEENIKGQNICRFSIRTVLMHSFVLSNYGPFVFFVRDISSID